MCLLDFTAPERLSDKWYILKPINGWLPAEFDVIPMQGEEVLFALADARVRKGIFSTTEPDHKNNTYCLIEASGKIHRLDTVHCYRYPGLPF